MDNKKYILTDERIVIKDSVAPYKTRELFRIKAVKNFLDVKEGDLGGYVQDEENLSQQGDCWIYEIACVLDEARVYGSAKVYGRAFISGDAKIYGKTQVSDSACINGNTRVFENAQISGNAQVYGEAQVSGNAQVYGEAQVYGGAQVSGNAQVYDGAQISGNAQVSGEEQVSGNRLVETGYITGKGLERFLDGVAKWGIIIGGLIFIFMGLMTLMSL